MSMINEVWPPLGMDGGTGSPFSIPGVKIGDRKKQDKENQEENQRLGNCPSGSESK